MTQEEINSTNWSQSVAGVCLKEGKVLLARHTYGSGNGKLIIPGGYVKFGEVPEETLVREYLEETGVRVKADVVEMNGHGAQQVFGFCAGGDAIFDRYRTAPDAFDRFAGII